MPKVTSVSKTKQPKGGYIGPRAMKVTVLSDDNILCEKESVKTYIVGLAVVYLARFMSGEDCSKAFEISYLGAKELKMEDKYFELLNNIKGLDEKSIKFACKIVGFDCAYRAGIGAYRTLVEEIDADTSTCSNIKIMVTRTLEFLKKYGPIVKFGFKFDTGLTKKVSQADGDLVTKDTIWDFRVITSHLTSLHTFQLAIKYFIAKKEVELASDSKNVKLYKNIKNIGIFNPRTNTVYKYNMAKITNEYSNDIKYNVIGYRK